VTYPSSHYRWPIPPLITVDISLRHYCWPIPPLIAVDLSLPSLLLICPSPHYCDLSLPSLLLTYPSPHYCWPIPPLTCSPLLIYRSLGDLRKPHNGLKSSHPSDSYVPTSEIISSEWLYVPTSEMAIVRRWKCY
jgi:hypothetical protein